MTVPINGAEGIDGCGLTTTAADEMDDQDPNFALTEYDPAGAVIVDPDCVTPADGVTV